MSDFEVQVPRPGEPMAERMTAAQKAADPLRGVKCQARNRQGRRCSKDVGPGHVTCSMHGGGSPNARDTARRRIESALPMAVRRIKQLAKQKSEPAVALAAARDIIKLNNLEPPQRVDANVTYRWKTDADDAASENPGIVGDSGGTGEPTGTDPLGTGGSTPSTAAPLDDAV